MRQVLTRIESIKAKTYFIILAETGLRPGEPFLVTMDDADFESPIPITLTVANAPTRTSPRT